MLRWFFFFSLFYSFHDRMDATHESLCDSINTAGAMSEIMALINQTNKYMTGGASVVNVDILQDISSWVSRMLDVRLSRLLLA